jgi:glycosyltransferase involved in cell wall biosynthesis
MKKVLFFTQNRWAFGSIHHALCKELYKFDIYANLLDWTVEYTRKEFDLLNDTYDFFVTMPDAVLQLHYKYGIPLEKIVSVAHAQWDVLLAKQQADFDFYPRLHKFSVISQVLKDKCNEWGISVNPMISKLGLHFDLFYGKPSTSLSKIGYGGSNEINNFFGQEIKRPKLIEEVIDGLEGFELVRHQFYNHMCMPAYYKSIDCIIMSSIEEAGGLPMMESAAAGRLCMGTPVGYFEHNSQNGGGILLPMDSESFVSNAKAALNYYKNNPEEYHKKCLDIQEYARYNYDWKYVIDGWIELFN